MRNFFIWAAIGIGLVIGISELASRLVAPSPAAEAAPVTEDAVTLQLHTAKAIELAAPRQSAGRNKLIETMLVYIAKEVFSTQEHQEFWISLIGVESRYESTAKSHAGAVGLGQLIPRYKNDFGKGCGLTEIDSVDVNDDFVNAYLSACYFRTLIESHNGSIPLALISYNAGPHSHDIKKAKNGSAPGQEPSAYTTKVWVQRNQAAETK